MLRLETHVGKIIFEKLKNTTKSHSIVLKYTYLNLYGLNSKA